MRRYRKGNVKSFELKKRITKNRARVRFVGFILLLAVIALAVAVAAIPVLKGGPVSLTVAKFWKGFKNPDWKSYAGLLKLTIAGLYALMLLGLVVNVFRALAKLGDLHKKKGTKMDGFNHNTYAMNGLGKIFSGSFAVVVLTYFLIYLLNREMTMEGKWLLIVLGGGIFVHLLTGFIGSKASYFDFDGEHLVEQKREVGRLAPLVRNVLQLAGVFAMMYFLTRANYNSPMLNQWLTKDVVKFVKAQGERRLILNLGLLAILLWTAVLLKHATGTAEYSIDGAYGRGMKTYRVFSFFAFLTAGCIVGWRLIILKQKPLDVEMLIVAEIALANFIVELIMRNRPRLPEEKTKKVDDGIMLDGSMQKPTEEKAAEDTVATYPSAPAPSCPVAAQGYPYPSQYPVMMPMQSAPLAPALLLVPTTQPMGVPTIAPAPALQEIPANVEEETEEQEETAVENRKGIPVEVNCPFCNKRLRVNSGAKYHRCPVCERVFAIRVSGEE